MFSRSALACLVAAGLAVTVAPAFAGKGAGSATGTSRISIATVDGASLAAASVKPTPKLGDALTFATTVEPLAGWEYPMVSLSCFQDVNGDGVVNTSVTGPDLVFAQLDKPSATYTLGGYSSIWTQRGGGNATCRAELDAYGFKGGKESIRVLAATGNWAAQG